MAMDDNKCFKSFLDVARSYGGAVLTFPHQPDVGEFLEMDFNQRVAGVAETLAAIRADTAPQPVVHLKRIESVTAGSPILILPDVSTALQVEAQSHLKGAGTFTWRKLEGPGEVTFNKNNNAAAAQTTATFDAVPGTYVLEVTMTDEHGLTSVAKTVDVQVRRQ